MKTDDLVTMLATGAGAVHPHAAQRRYAIAMGAGVLGAALPLLGLLGVRPDLGTVALAPMLWVKVAFVAMLAVASLLAAVRLSLPGLRLAWMPALFAAPVLAVWLAAIIMLARAEPAQRGALLFGQTWASCPLLIAILSVPTFIGVLWAMQGLAPTRLRLAGSVAGLLAGATGALVYCLHCPESTVPFLGVWYLLGMLIPAVAGALLGPRVLRW